MENVRYNPYSLGSSGWSSLRNYEFHEEDIVWGDSSSRVSAGSQQTRSITILKSRKQISNPVNPESAPMNIPDWSKIYGNRTKTSCSLCDGDGDGIGGDSGFPVRGWPQNEDDEEEKEEEDEDEEEVDVIPPHEWLARRRMSSFSMCEGAGRTLKGRDLSRLRNAVLIKTGFLESKSGINTQQDGVINPILNRGE